MPIRLQRFLHPFQVEADESAESIHRNLALAVGPADRFHTHAQFGGQLIGGDPEPSHGFSSLTVMSPRTVLTIAMRAVMMKDPWRGHEGTGGDTGGQKDARRDERIPTHSGAIHQVSPPFGLRHEAH